MSTSLSNTLNPQPTPSPSAPASEIVRGQGGAGADSPGFIPPLQLPPPGQMLVQVEQDRFRAVISRFEGTNLQHSAMEIGELEAVEIKNALTDEVALRKRLGSSVVSSGSTGYVIGLHEVAGPRVLTLHNCDSAAGWTPSDAVNFPVVLDTSVKVEGTGSLRFDASGAGASGDTVVYDFGAGSTKDLRQFDAVECVMRTTASGSTVSLGVSEDNVTYTEAGFAGVGLAGAWVLVRLDISALGATARDAIRYLRFRCFPAPGAAQSYWADSIRAVRRTQHLLRAARQGSGGVGGWREPGSTAEVFIESNETGTWSPVAATPAIPAASVFSAVNWVGNTYYALGDGGMGKIVNGVASAWTDAPPSKLIEMHKEKLWAFSQPFDLNGLRHTDVNSDSVWPVSTNPSERGAGGLFYVGRGYSYLPTGMKSSFGQLFLWTEGDLWILFGEDNTTWDLQRAHPGAGTLSHNSIARFDTGIIWHDGLQNRILWWHGGNVSDASERIKPILTAIPDARKPWAAGFFDGRYYFFAYTRAGQTVNDRCVVLDTLYRRWHGPFQGSWVGFSSGLVGVDGARYVGLENNLGVRKVLSGADDAGTAIDFAWKSGALRFRLPHWTKRLRRFWMKCLSTTATFTVNFYTDLSASPIETAVLTFTGQPFETQTVGVTNLVAGDAVQVEITESSALPVAVTEIGMDGYLLRRLR